LRIGDSHFSAVGQVPTLAAGIVLDLIGVDLADAEIVRS
jgi:hypothetical protein